MLTRNSRLGRTRPALVLAASASAYVCVPVVITAAQAQEAPPVAAELPPIVIEGATIEAKPIAKVKAKAKPAPVVEADEPVAATKPAKKVKKAAAPAAPQQQAAPPAEVTSSDFDAAASTATSSTGNQDFTGVEAEKIGSAVTVVSGESLRSQEVNSTTDALRSLPGVSVSRTNGITGLTQIRIRGAEGNHTMVLIDGIEVNDSTNGEFDFANLSPDGIEQIEVIRGPQSGIYGSGALGGVINVITKSGRGPLTFYGSAGGGSFETSNLTAGMSAGNDQGWGSISFSQLNTQGFNVSPFGNEDDGGKLQTFALRAGGKVAEDITVDLTLRNMKKEGDRDGFGGAAGTLATAVDDASTFESNIWLAGLTVRWDMLDGALSHVVRASNNRTERSDLDLSFPAFPYHFVNDGETTKFSYVGTLRFDTPMFVSARHAVSAMVEHTAEDFTPLSDFEDGIKRGREQLSEVAEWRGEFADRLYTTASVRHDDNNAFEDFTTWRTNASLALREIGLRPHASVGTGVKLPTQFEQFGSLPNFYVPNPNLKPEESLGWDAGVEATILNGGAVIDVTYFKADLENEIRTTGFPSTAINDDGTSHRQGVEVAAKVRLTPELVLGASYTYLDATDSKGLEEVRRAPHSGRADLTYTFASGLGHISLAAVYNGKMLDTAFRMPFFSQELVTLDSYWLVSAAASYKLAQGVELYGRVENLLDQNYQEAFGYETAGLAAYAGMRFTYEEPSTRDWVKYK